MTSTLFRRILSLFLTAILAAGLAACAVHPAPSAPTEPTVPREEDALYSALFDLNSHIKIDIRMEESEVAKMQADFDRYSARGSKSPIYRMADVDITVTSDGRTAVYTMEQVGVRMKGNTSRNPFYSADQGIYNLIHLKLSFQETFDDEAYYGSDALEWASKEDRKARKNRTFAGLEKMDLRWNRCDDTTYIKEYYAYEVFRANGIPAPRTNLASVDWAGAHAGVFTIYEPVDQVFLERRFPEAEQGGDLYKCGWSSVGASFAAPISYGIEDEDAGAFYAYDLKTNKKTSQHEALLRFINELNGDGLTKEGLAGLLDMDSFLTFAAISYFLGNPDDLRNNYNNFYIYFRPSDGRAIFIPYDYDRCFGITRDWDPTGHAMTLDDPFSTTIAATGARQESPLFIYTVDAGGWYVEEYARRLEALSQSPWLDPARFAQYFAIAEANYAAETVPGKTYQNARGHHFKFRLDPPSGNRPFADYMAAKQRTLALALADLDSYLQAEPTVPAEYFIRGSFNGWSVQPGYEMERPQADGMYTFTVSCTDQLALKVFSVKRGAWYGAERLSEDSPILCGTDPDTNIILPAGSYQIAFDPETEQILILPA